MFRENQQSPLVEFCAEHAYQLLQCLHFLPFAGFAMKQRGEIELMVVLGRIREAADTCFRDSDLVQSVDWSALFGGWHCEPVLWKCFGHHFQYGADNLVRVVRYRDV